MPVLVKWGGKDVVWMREMELAGESLHQRWLALGAGPQESSRGFDEKKRLVEGIGLWIPKRFSPRSSHEDLWCCKMQIVQGVRKEVVRQPIHWRR